MHILPGMGISKYPAKLHIHLPFDPVIPPLETYPKDAVGKKYTNMYA